MILGVPREIKNEKRRVGLLSSGACRLNQRGRRVLAGGNFLTKRQHGSDILLRGIPDVLAGRVAHPAVVRTFKIQSRFG